MVGSSTLKPRAADELKVLSRKSFEQKNPLRPTTKPRALTTYKVTVNNQLLPLNMSLQSISSLLRFAVWVASVHTVTAFAPHHSHAVVRHTALYHAPSEATATASFIDTELRGAAMKLHTREQAPKEGQAPAPAKKEPYVTTHEDYLRFLVDSQHMYKAFEEIVNERGELALFRNTGLERVAPLETDIDFLTKEYNLKRPAVGKLGQTYAEHLRGIESVPEFVCHFYNFYFAHTAGGRMIGT